MPTLWLMHIAAGVVLAIGMISSPVAAQRGAVTATVSELRRATTRDTIVLRIAVDMTTGWHIGAAQPGVIGVPTELSWQLPVGWRVLEPRWTAPVRNIIGRDTVFEYRGPFTIDAKIVADGLPQNGAARIILAYGICKDVCLPGRVTLTHQIR